MKKRHAVLKTVLGVSLDGSRGRCVLLSKGRGGIRILKALPLETLTDSPLPLDEVLRKEGLRKGGVSVVLPRHMVPVRYVYMPPLEGENLRGAVQFEAAKHFAFELNEAYWDCDVAGKDESVVPMAVAALHKDALDALVSSWPGLAGRLSSIGVSSFALHGCYQWLRDREKWGLSMLVDCGGSGLNVVVCDESSLLWCRGIPRAVGDKKQKVDWIAEEIHRSVEAYVRGVGGLVPERILLSGEMEDADLLLKRVQTEFDVPVSLLNPFLKAESMDKVDVSEAQAYAAAMGAGLAGLGEAGLSINILPKPDPMTLRSLLSKDKLEQMGYLALACLLMVFLSLLWDSHLKDKRLQGVLSQIQALEAPGKETEVLIGEVRDLSKDVDRFKTVRKDCSTWIDVLKELYLILPDDRVTVEKIEFSKDSLDELACKAPSATELIKLLEESLFFEGVSAKGAITADPKEPDTERFSLVGKVSRKEL